MSWTRLHPLTPFVRAGRYLLIAGAIVGQQGVRDADAELLLLVLAAGVPVALIAAYLSWRTTRYRVEGNELHLASGILQKRDRRVPLARVQSIDVVRPFLARFLGLAELRLEVVGGDESEARLAYLDEQAAEALRASLLALVSGRAPEAARPELALVTVPTGTLVASVALGSPVVIAAVLLLALVPTALVDLAAAGALLVAALSFLLAAGGVAVRRLLAEYGFTVSEVPGGLRLRHGLLDRRTQTIPLGRVQTVRVLEPLLWRRQGWVRVEVDVAGYSATRGEEEAATSVLLPVAPRDFAEALVARVLGASLPAATAGVPRAARLRVPLSWRRRRVGVDELHVVSCSGVLTTTTDVVPLAKVQSLRLVQGPWQRRLGLASVHVDSAGRRLRGATLAHRDVREASALLEELTERARLRR